MDSMDMLAESFGRIRELVHEVVNDLGPRQLTFRVDDRANTIAWLVWHLSRVQDDHIADAANRDQVWFGQGWCDRFELPFDPSATGFGSSSADVAAVRVHSPSLLTGYLDAVHAETLAFLEQIDEADLDRVIDDSWDPPVTLGVRLVSVVSDDLQHVGQAAFIRGVMERSASA